MNAIAGAGIDAAGASACQPASASPASGTASLRVVPAMSAVETGPEPASRAGLSAPCPAAVCRSAKSKPAGATNRGSATRFARRTGSCPDLESKLRAPPNRTLWCTTLGARSVFTTLPAAATTTLSRISPEAFSKRTPPADEDASPACQTVLKATTLPSSLAGDGEVGLPIEMPQSPIDPIRLLCT